MKPFFASVLFMLCGVSGGVTAADEGLAPDTLSLALHGSRAHDALAGEIMTEGGISSTLSGRVGFAFFGSEQTGLHGGLDGGVRASLAGAISPFIGAGAFLGSWSDYELADRDGIDNDEDGLIDEAGEEAEVRDDLLAVYPEVGVHLRLGRALRLTGSYRYYVTSKGCDSDRVLYGFSIGLLF